MLILNTTIFVFSIFSIDFINLYPNWLFLNNFVNHNNSVSLSSSNSSSLLILLFLIFQLTFFFFSEKNF